MLNKETLKQTIEAGLRELWLEQNDKATTGSESESPEQIIASTALRMADIISTAVDEYVRSGDVLVSMENIAVTSTPPGTPATVITVSPAKIR